jgi:ubiquitin-like domain-containing CTD phosphatase 1
MEQISSMVAILPITLHVRPLKKLDRSAKNTIHIDDLSRNFALNPSAGLKILPFKDCHTARAQQDRELERLMRYLLHLAEVGDFSRFDHRVSPFPLLSLPDLNS